ncbi:MAG: undecaprenyl-diphosphate phosphatase [Tissierellia bacterium]|nr:undecaprenyl-diphosphate phosphatase [Tissierellia bacterium]
MDLIKVLLLGIIEGITEFLPISSTGHLIIAHELLPLRPEAFQNVFDVCIQLGPILAVVVLYWHKLWPFRGRGREGMRHRRRTFTLWFKVLVGVLPSVVFGLLLDDWIDAHLFSTTVVMVTLIVWGIIIILLERGRRGPARVETVDELPIQTALLIGCFQVLAMVPGTSRSAATIMGALLLGLSRPAAAEFSFYLAIPTMFGAFLLKMVKNGTAFTALQWGYIFIGGLVGFVVAVIVIKKFMGYIKAHDFQVFGIYRIGLGILLGILTLTGVLA